MSRSSPSLSLVIVLLGQHRNNLPKLVGWLNEGPCEDHLGNPNVR